MHYVIIGGGIAGTTAAEELRKLNPVSEITIVSQEIHPVYSRVLLPHFLKGKVPRERVFLKKVSWYDEQKIEWLTGISVVQLDTKNKFVGLSDGRELPYDKLLITTGGELRTLFSDARGVSYFRTLDDADHLQQLLSERTEKSLAVVYGGGFIACEYINIFAHYQIPFSVAFRGPYFWPRLLETEAGELIQKQLLSHGIALHPHSVFSEVVGEKELRAVKTSSGEHPCSLLGVGIGIETDFSWIQEAGIETGSGIKCDEFLKTNVADVYTAGDVAEFFDVIVGRQIHIGNWMNAMMQGRHVARTMFGQEKTFELVSSYATNVLGLEIIFVGDVSKEHADEVKVFGSVQSGGVVQLFARAGQLVGAVLIGRNQDRAQVTKLIQSRSQISVYDFHHF